MDVALDNGNGVSDVDCIYVVVKGVSVFGRRKLETEAVSDNGPNGTVTKTVRRGWGSRSVRR
jgi:hypothetical protein